MRWGSIWRPSGCGEKSTEPPTIDQNALLTWITRPAARPGPRTAVRSVSASVVKAAIMMRRQVDPRTMISSSKQPRGPVVACVSLDPRGPGGMAEVLRSLLASPLAQRYRIRMIVTYALVSAPRRLLRYLGALAELVVWCLGPGTR